MRLFCIVYRCCGYIWKVIFLLPQLRSKQIKLSLFRVAVINQPRSPSRIPRMLHCPLFDCRVYGGCFITGCECPCQRCPSSRFHKSASCHDGVAFIIRLWFCRPGPGAAGERWLSHSASRRGERWEGRRCVLSSLSV